MASAAFSSLLFVLLASPVAALGSAAAANSKVKVSPVQKVIQLIDDMAAKVTKEDNELKATFEEYAKFCDDEAVSKGYAIKDSQEKIESLNAAILDSQAVVQSETAKVQDASTKISDTEAEVATAGQLREKERADFVKTEQELVSTVEELSGAQKAIKNSMAFVQAQGGKMSSEDRATINAVVQGLCQVVEASFVTPQQKKQIAALLQARTDAEEEAEFGSRTMSVDAIMETLADMEDKASQSLTEARKGEADAQGSHNLLSQGLNNEIANSKKEMSESNNRKAGAAKDGGQAQTDLSLETKGLKEDQAYTADLKRDCQNRAGDFEVETKDNNAEVTALGKAKAILLKKFAALVQTSTATKGDGGDVKARALRAIEQLGRRLHRTALVALAYRAASDPFGKIRSMVEDMIAKLLQEAAEEATQKAFCDQEIGESTASKEDKQGKLGKVNARLEKAESATATLTEEISRLSAEVAENDAGMKAATDVRQREKSDFMAAEKDLSESEDACAAATQVLREYYEGASLVQVGVHTKTKADAEGNDASGILGVLEVAESDFAKGLAEARAAEQQAQTEYDQMMQDGKMVKATKETEIKGKQSEVASLRMTASDLNTDKESLGGELDAVLAYLDKLKPQCETKVPSYAERKAAREQEIEGLKNALDMLEAPALLQTGRFLSRTH